MDSRVESGALIMSVAAVVVVEIAARLLIASWVAPTMVITGGARLAQLGFLAWIVMESQAGPAAIWWRKDQLWAGLKTGTVWALVFGLGAGGLLGGMLLMGLPIRGIIGASLPHRPGDLALFFLVGGLISPVAEEVLFRGVLYGFFRRWGVAAAMIASTLLFVAAHRPGSVLPVPQIVGGILFAAALERTRNLMTPITIHVLGNLGLFTLALLMPEG